MWKSCWLMAIFIIAISNGIAYCTTKDACVFQKVIEFQTFERLIKLNLLVENCNPPCGVSGKISPHYLSGKQCSLLNRYKITAYNLAKDSICTSLWINEWSLCLIDRKLKRVNRQLNFPWKYWNRRLPKRSDKTVKIEDFKPTIALATSAHCL